MGLILVLLLAGVSAIMASLFGYPLWVMIVLGGLWLAALVVCALVGHQGFGGKGNTDLLIAIAGASIAAAILIPNYSAHKPCNQARAALRTLADAEYQYSSEHHSFTTDLSLLNLKPNPDIRLAVIKADAESFIATASHRLCEKGKAGAPEVFTWDSGKGGLQ